MTTSFKEFALNPALHTSLDNMKFETPTPIQAMAIPFALEGRDILGSAQTGTGKTAAFCVPMVNFLLENPTAHALVMLPTRELATQVHDVARKMIGYDNKGPNGIKTALLIGGEPIGKQYAQLDRRPRLIVGTPGRINDHLRSNGDLVDRVEFVVLDEADRMLDMGFSVQIDSILSETAMKRQTLMFSATFPDSIVKFSRTYLNNPERVSAGVQSRPGENIIQESMQVAQERKYDELQLQLAKREGSVIIFVRTKHGADKLAEKLNRDEHGAEALHGGLRQRQRDRVIASFRKSQIRIMVATDVAARGLDVPHIEHVINFDLPQVAEDYIHRIGRTARAGAKGHSVSFISPSERGLWRDIERMLDPNVKNPEEGREGGRGKGKSFGGPKKSFGGKPSFGGKKEGGFGARKPFGRADRQERNDNSWSPDGDFKRAEGGDRPERSFKKPFSNDGDFASNPDAYKRTNSESRTRSEGGFKKPYNRDGGSDRPRGDRPFNRDGGQQRSEGGFKKPYSRDGGSDRPQGDRPYNRDGGQQRSEGGFKKPYSRDGGSDRPQGDRPYNRDGGQQRSEGGYNKPYNRDGASSDRPRGDRPYNRDGGSDRPRGDRPFNRDGAAPRSEGGFKKPYNRDGASSDRPRSNGDRPFNRDGAKPRTEGGFKKPFSKDGQKPRSEGQRFNKDGAPRSEGHAKKRASY